MNLEKLANRCLAACHRRGWRRTWDEGGCYLHLEASEFIEALRGKGEDSPAQEAADVLFVLLSMLKGNEIDLDDVLKALNLKCDVLLMGGD